ncbi:MAG: DUF368 domain-containing protein [Bacilli bacterium]|jgi:putative membrane protein|nr:DUF368 domain-containing protein [Bacilli bacterium]
MKMKKWWLDFLKGTTIGFAIPIPGVSGGTMAVLSGIFDKIIDAVSNFKTHFKESFKTLLPIALGALTMAIIGFIGIKKGFDYAPFALSALFGGLVLGSLPTVTRELKANALDFWGVFRIIVGFIVAAGVGIASSLIFYYYGFSIAEYMASDVWWIYPVFLAAGFIGAVASVIPGISGSMIMYLMGLYVPLVSLFTTWSNWGEAAYLPLILGGAALIVIGALAGFVVANLWMKSLLSKRHDQTYQTIFGFILGSLVSMFANPQMIRTDEATLTKYWVYANRPTGEWIVGVILFVGAAVLLFCLTTKAYRKKGPKKLPNENEGE